jgi:hypothetical protein
MIISYKSWPSAAGTFISYHLREWSLRNFLTFSSRALPEPAVWDIEGRIFRVRARIEQIIITGEFFLFMASWFNF